MSPSRKGLPWLPEEEAFIRECAHAKIPAQLIAPLLDRTDSAVRMRRFLLNLPPPKLHSPYMCAERGAASVAEIKTAVASRFNLTVEELVTRRDWKASRPRQVAMFFAREVARKSYPHIGALFGGKDHTTVIHAVRQVERRMEQDHNFKDEVTTLERELVSSKDKQVVDKPPLCAFPNFAAGA